MIKKSEFPFVGMRFAVTEIKAVLCTLIGKYELSLEPSDDVPSVPTGMLFFSQNTAKLKMKQL